MIYYTHDCSSRHIYSYCVWFLLIFHHVGAAMAQMVDDSVVARSRSHHVGKVCRRTLSGNSKQQTNEFPNSVAQDRRTSGDSHHFHSVADFFVTSN